MPRQFRKDFGLPDAELGVKKVLMATQQGSFGETYGGVGTGPEARGLARRRYRDYRTVLMPATKALQDLDDQETIFFAAYDPFLDGAEGIELAYEAAVDYAAYGFKYYPPSGSRAIENPDPELPKARHKRAAWRSRYVENGKTLTGKVLDARIARFLDWTIDSNLPVFTHANPNEFEADHLLRLPVLFALLLDEVHRERRRSVMTSACAWGTREARTTGSAERSILIGRLRTGGRSLPTWR